MFPESANSPLIKKKQLQNEQQLQIIMPKNEENKTKAQFLSENFKKPFAKTP
jgi:hypothetical protein